ncbi:hypothetical protein BST61_g11367 [Cercospora zeina]
MYSSYSDDFLSIAELYLTVLSLYPCVPRMHNENIGGEYMMPRTPIVYQMYIKSADELFINIHQQSIIGSFAPSKMSTSTLTTTVPKTVQTTLNYYLTPEKGGSKDIYPGRAANYRQKFDVHPASVTDIRTTGEDFSLDEQGFQVEKHNCSEKEWKDDDKIREIAYPEVRDLVKRVTGASHVHIIGHFVRRHSWENAAEAIKDLDDKDLVPLKSYSTNRYCHIDQSYNGAEAILRDELPQDAERLGKTRWAIINVWRPIARPVTREALAVCDARTVSDATDLHEVRLHIAQTSMFASVNTSDKFIAWAVTANATHHWYYASNLTPEEALVFKIYDTSKTREVTENGRKVEKARARRVPHCAFITDQDHGPERESVEVRCLVFWEDQKN